VASVGDEVFVKGGKQYHRGKIVGWEKRIGKHRVKWANRKTARGNAFLDTRRGDVVVVANSSQPTKLNCAAVSASVSASRAVVKTW
jgi:hypothetical protein